MIDSAPAPVVIASFRSVPEAHVARTAIESAGIEVSLTNEYTIGVDWTMSNALGGVGVVVAAEDADRALQVLDGIWPDEADPPAAPDELDVVEVARCPACGATDIVRIQRLPIFIILTTLLLGIGHVVGQIELFGVLIAVIAGIFVFGPNRRCGSCGERWRSWTDPPVAIPPIPDVAVEPPVVACPRCGSPETFPISRRNLKAWTLLVNFTLPPLLFLWPFLAKRKCEECGHEFR